MKAKKKAYSLWHEPSFLVGVVLTLVVGVAFSYSLFCLPVVRPGGAYLTKWHYLREATPNEIGDTLAGLAGSLAFVWLVVTVMLQAKELREQRQEFEKMATAQTKQVDLLSVQGEIFQQEQVERANKNTELLLNSLLELFLENLALVQMQRQDGSRLTIVQLFKLSWETSIDQNLQSARRTLIGLSSEPLSSFQEGEFFVSIPPNLDQITETITRAVELDAQLPEHQRLRLNRLGLAQFPALLLDLQNHPFAQERQVDS